ncbi:CDP-alcohol phosphatidyltransferase family protein [Demequina globuliformis]|uniref:CDP-alcohol phosphatidyltransferase family protein n=1 Tax=Demequina globuliformis TaxID=676202 RepID=UPI0007822E60|nr:CDP-alcohol phosphatidyltransferase family protein [Demequina globuliformis]
MTDETLEPRLGRQHPTVADVKRDGQPEHIRTRANAEHWSADVWWRHLSPYVSTTAIRLGLSANAVSVVMILCGWAAAASLLAGAWWGALLAVLFAHGQMLIDAADGEVARWRRTMSPRGIFLDRIAHTTTESLMPLCFGIGLGLGTEDVWKGVAGGAVLGLLVLINKSVNDAVAVSRAYAGLGKLPDTKAAHAPKPGLVATARRAARLVPLHRLYHSVEQSHVYFVALVLSVWIAGFAGWVLLAMVVVTPFVIAGHIAAVWTSSRLTAQ